MREWKRVVLYFLEVRFGLGGEEKTLRCVCMCLFKINGVRKFRGGVV